MTVGKNEVETILWLNTLGDDTIRAREAVQEFYGERGDLEVAREKDRISKRWEVKQWLN